MDRFARQHLGGMSCAPPWQRTSGRRHDKQRLEGAAITQRPQRRGIGIDALLDDLAILQLELVDAAKRKAAAIDKAVALPLDDDGIAARGPVEQLPDKIRRLLLLQIVEPADLGAAENAIGKRVVELAVGVPQGKECVAVARGPRRGKTRDEILDV